MKITEVSGGDMERQILSLFVHSNRILESVEPIWDNDFRSTHANLIGRWCLSHYKKHGCAPKEQILNKFNSWKERSLSNSDVSSVESILSKVRVPETSYRENIELVENYFTKTRLEKLKESLDTFDDEDKKTESVTKYAPFKVESSNVVEVLSGVDSFRKAYMEEQEGLIGFDGALGEFFGNHLCRDGFISFLAPPKRGKSWWLQEVALAAAYQGKRVLFFSVGDLSENQQLRRFATSISKKPKREMTLEVPRSVSRIGGDIKVTRESKQFQAFSLKSLEKRMVRLRVLTRGASSLFRLLTYSNSSITIDEIASKCKRMAISGWKPDVVVIDYADILLFKGQEIRESINDSWKKMRKLSQDLNCLLLTATQGNKDSYTANVLGKDNFSDDRRKNDHVTGIIGINQTTYEKELGVYRLNWCHCREGSMPENKCVTVASCLEIGSVAICSCWDKGIPNPLKKPS